MRWYLAHGANHAALIDRKAPVPEYMIPPIPLAGYDAWFSAFWELSTDRRTAGGPIPAREIREYPIAEHERNLFHRCIRAMDRVMLEHYAPKKEGEVSKTPLTPALFLSKFGGRKAND